MLEGSDYLKLGIFVLLLILSAFFSSSETAFMALQRVRIIHLVRTRVPGAKRVLNITQHPERLLPTVLLGNNLVNTAAAALGTAMILSLLDNANSAILIATAGVTLLLLIFGEIIPKTFAARHSERFAFTVVHPLQLVDWVLFPLVRALRGFSTLVARVAGTSGQQIPVTEQEIRSLISVGKEAGAVEASEAEMLEKVFHFGDRHVAEIMTPRPEIVSIEKQTTLRHFLTVYAEHYHTRFPVFEDSEDNIIGVISVKDIMKAQGQEELQLDSEVTHLLRPAHFVPETKTVGSLFTELRERGQSISMLVDEYGGIAGLVTLKQLISVIVGPVGEEGQPLESPYSSVGNNTFLLDADLSVDQANERLGLYLPLGEYQTLAGFVLERLGRIPREGDRLQYDDIRFTIHEMNGVKIEKIELIRTAPVIENDIQ